MNTVNTYQIGLDFRSLPKTNISFDQFFHEFKSDTTYVDPVSLVNGSSALLQLSEDSLLPRQLFQLSNGQLVDIGAIYNFNASSPCASTTASPFIANAATDPDTMKPNCNGYLAYQRRGNIRSSYPTSQLSFQTSYIKNLDLSGRLVYSSSDLDVLGSNGIAGYQGTVNLNGYAEFYQGLVTRTNQRQFAIGGPVRNKRQSWTGDVAMTVYFTDNFRLTEQFRYDRWRIPGSFDMLELSLFPVSPQTTVSLLNPTASFTPGTAPPASCPTITSAGCPLHSNSSPADVASELFRQVLKQKIYSNQIELAYDLNRHFGGHVGYRFRNRRIDHLASTAEDLTFFPTLPNRGGCTPATNPGATNQPDGSCRLIDSSASSEEWEIGEHSGIFGVWARVNDQFRMNYDMELMYSDFAFTRISPRHRQRYKFRASYKPTDWLNFAGNVNFIEQGNNVDEIFHRQHNRTYAFVVAAMKERWGFDIGYDYNDVESRTNICFTLTGTPLPSGSSPCPVSVPAATTSVISLYDNKLHFAYFNFMVKPFKRLTTNFGYTVSSTAGETTALGPLNYPRGPLAFNWHKPYAGVEIEMSKNVFLKSSWGYYGYNEKEVADTFTSPTDSLGRLVGRDFRGNLFTASAKFVF
jgi:opacity protein-like surface antigen